MRIKVTADSTCDLSRELIEKHDIGIIPLHIIKDGKAYSDGVDIKPENIFEYVDKGGELPATAAINIDEYKEYFADILKKYDGIVHINIGSGFSSCYQNACIAAKELQNVEIVDSKNLSSGSGHLVLEAALQAKKGDNIKGIARHLERVADNVETSFLLDRLDYMEKGGRCSVAVALGANLLRLKPCIEVKNGKMSVGKKYRGSFEKCLCQYVNDRLKDRQDINRDRIFISHPDCSEKTVKLVKSEVKGNMKFKNIYETKAGCTISSHCGPNTLGIVFMTGSTD